MRTPETAGQWQEAVDIAHAALALDAARQYGLVEGGPKVNVERCQEMLERGARTRIYPRADATDRFLRALLRGG